MAMLAKVNKAVAQKSPSHHSPVLIIGAGPAGLMVSSYLRQRGIEHLILDKGLVGESWRAQRWDSLRLTGPNWLFQLPGFPNPSRDPDGFMRAKEVVDYFECFSQRIQAPLQCGKHVVSVTALPARKGFCIETMDGDRYTAEQLVVATGIFHSAKMPDYGADLPERICQLTPSAYRRPTQLPPGAILIVGCGESGSQIAEELLHSGRTVYLSVGRTQWKPRRYRGRDFCWWNTKLGTFDNIVFEFRRGKSTKNGSGGTVTGGDGGHDINLHTLARDGAILLGHLEGIRNGKLILANDLYKRIVDADAQAMAYKAAVDQYIETNQVDAAADDWPAYAEAYEALPPEPIMELDIGKAGISTVLWATGHRPDFSYIELPVFDKNGELIHERWVTPYAGFYFFGFPFLFENFAIEAEYLASVIASKVERDNKWQQSIHC